MNPRPMRLVPWMIRAAIPSAHIGTYVLHASDGAPVYIGRSDTDLQRRLVQHAQSRRADYFTFDVHPSTRVAFEVECSLFHSYADGITNAIHPDTPNYADLRCPFCPQQLRAVLQGRLRLPALSSL